MHSTLQTCLGPDEYIEGVSGVFMKLNENVTKRWVSNVYTTANLSFNSIPLWTVGDTFRGGTMWMLPT